MGGSDQKEPRKVICQASLAWHVRPPTLSVQPIPQEWTGYLNFWKALYSGGWFGVWLYAEIEQQDFLRTFPGLSQDFLKTSSDFLRNLPELFLRLSQEFLRTSSALKQNILTTQFVGVLMIFSTYVDREDN